MAMIGRAWRMAPKRTRFERHDATLGQRPGRPDHVPWVAILVAYPDIPQEAQMNRNNCSVITPASRSDYLLQKGRVLRIEKNRSGPCSSKT